MGKGDRKMAPEIRLGDVVTLSSESGTKLAWTHCVVFRVQPDGKPDLFRPYVHLSDFSYGHGATLITYIGHEEIHGVRPELVALVERCRGERR